MFVVTKYMHGEESEFHELFGTYGTLEDAKSAIHNDLKKEEEPGSVANNDYDGMVQTLKKRDVMIFSETWGEELFFGELIIYWMIFDSDHPQRYEF